MSFTSLLSFALVASAVLAAPAPRAPLRQLKKTSGEATGRYIVVLKEGVSKDDVAGTLSTAVTNKWDTVLNGFAGTLATGVLVDIL